MKPTDELYQSLEHAYAHFNRALFEGILPDVIFTVQRQKGMMGYFAPERWSSLSGEHCHEIAINPSHLGESRLIEVLQTLVHEMVHCWQHCFGKPARSCYHNKEWAYKMMAVGLQPTSTGRPNGPITGQQMSDYPIQDGAFLKACFSLVNQQAYNIPWIDRRVTPKSLAAENTINFIPSDLEAMSDQSYVTDKPATDILTTNYSALLPDNSFFPVQQSARAKTKYQCPECRTNVWGRPDLDLICGQCDERFRELSS